MKPGSVMLGDVLVRDRVITWDQLTDALKNQVVYGGRLGTNLIELGYASHDQIALGLAKVHGKPAALTKHLMAHDAALAGQVPVELARRCLAFPIARLRSKTDQVAVCFRDPLPEAVRAMGAALGASVVVSVAAEATVLYWLERIYGLNRPQRYALSAPGGDVPMPRTTTGTMRAVTDGGVDVDLESDDSVEIDVDEHASQEFQLVDLDDRSVVKDTSLYQPRPTQVSALLEIAQKSSNLDLAEAAQRAATLASQAASNAVMATAARPAPPSRPVVAPPPPVESPRPAAIDLSAARAAIERATTRDQVSDAVLGYMAGSYAGALMLIVKGEMVLGYRGFGGNFDADTVESIVVPLSVPSVFKVAHDTLAVFSGAPPSDAHAVQGRFFKLFPGSAPAQVVVAPVAVKDRPVCMFYGHRSGGQAIPSAEIAAISDLAAATADAFWRLIRAAKQGR